MKKVDGFSGENVQPEHGGDFADQQQRDADVDERREKVARLRAHAGRTRLRRAAVLRWRIFVHGGKLKHSRAPGKSN